MTAREERQRVMDEIAQARDAGARLSAACREAGISARTWQRWQDADGMVVADARPQAECATPAHALSPAEREHLVAIANEPRFADLPPAQIVPRLADEGIYLASESSFHRVLCDAGQNAHRGRAKRPQPRHVGLPQRRAEQGKDRHDHDGRHRHAATMARDELAGAVRGFCSRAAFATFPALPVGLPGAPISRLLPCKRHCR